MTHDEPTTARAVDPATVAIAGAMTLAWYAVPDVVRPRWARALLKTAVGTAGAVLTVTSTTDGRQAQEAVRSLRDAVADLGAEPVADPGAVLPGEAVREDNDWVPDVARSQLPVPPAVIAAGAVGVVVASVAIVAAGEKCVYRRGEALRARGVRAPHTRVGLAMSAVAVAFAAVEPYLWPSSAE